MTDVTHWLNISVSFNKYNVWGTKNGPNQGIA